MENEMETGLLWGLYWGYVGIFTCRLRVYELTKSRLVSGGWRSWARSQLVEFRVLGFWVLGFSVYGFRV